MNRNMAVMRHGSLGFLLCSSEKELCLVLHCPEMTQEKDLKQSVL